MAGVVSTFFTKANCDTPGVFGIFHEYHMHASGLCHLAAWWPSNSFQAAPCIVFVGGVGYGNSPGWNQITGTINDNAKSLALAKELNAAGWVVIAIDYPVSGANEHTNYGADYQASDNGGFRMKGTWKEHTPVAMWPEQPAYVAIAIQYIKSNWCGVDGGNLSIFGKRLWGIGNSIDPDKVVLAGSDHGATMAAYVSLQPSGFYPFESGVSHDNMDRYVPRASHRVAAVVLQDPMIDFTQFYIDTGYTSPAGTIWMHDHFPAFCRCEDYRPWSDIEMLWKRQSPWWALAQSHPENANIGFFTEFTGTGTGDPAWDEDLTAATWSPGTVRDDTAHAKAWIDPRNGTFQGSPWRGALDTATRMNRFGASVTRYTDAGGAFEPYVLAEYPDKVMSWLEGFGL